MTSGRFSGDTRFVLESEDRDTSPDHSGDSLLSPGDHKSAASSSPKKSIRKSVQKKVVSIPIKDLDSSSRNKGEAAPPSDSWAWRKYGQKPIKGSPYPRGYYRCSSSKGCPARKQVERSRVDPTMLVVTYSSEHNHPWPPSSRTHNNANRSSLISAASDSAVDGGVSPNNSDVREPTDPYENNKLSTPNVAASDDGFHGWFSDMSFAAMLESPMLAETSSNDDDVSMLFPIMGEDEESFFADLEELPECSMVFRRREVMTAATAGGGTQWCGTTS
ncbi:unnamed protein product [Rhodiola kirilowii]